MFDRLTHRRGRLLFALAVLAGVLLLWNRTRQRELDDRLIRAARDGDLLQVEARLREGASPDAAETLDPPPTGIIGWLMARRRPYGRTVLEIAFLEKRWKVARRLVDEGAVVRPAQMAKAMHLAAEAGEVDVIRMLLDRGVSADIADTAGRTPLELAVREGQTAVVRLLLDRGATIAPALRGDPHTLSFERTSSPVAFRLLFRHAQEEVRQIVALLQEHGMDINARISGERTLLMTAAEFGTPETVQSLLELGADPDLLDNAGRTASDRARGLQRQENRDTIERWKKREPAGR